MFDYSLARVKSALLHFLLGQAFSSAIGLVVTLLLVREMSVGDYAIYTVFLGVTLILGHLSSLSIPQTARRYFPEMIVSNKHEELASLFIIAVTVRLISLIIFLTIVNIYRHEFISFMSLHIEPYVLTEWLIASFFVIQYRFIVNLQQIILQHKVMKWIAVGLNTTRVILIVAIYQSQGVITLTELIWVEAGSYFIFTIVSFVTMVYGLKKITHGSKFHFNTSVITSRIIRFFRLSSIRELVSVLNGYAVGRLIVGKIMSPAYIGAYGFSESLMNIISNYMPSVLLNNMMQPVIMAKYSESGDLKQLNNLSSIIFRINLTLLLPVFCLCIIGGSDVGIYLTKGKYPEVGYYLAGLILTLVFQSHLYFISLVAIATENMKFLLRGAMLMAMFLIPMIYLVYHYGVWGLIAGKLVGMLARDTYIKYQLNSKGITSEINISVTARLIMTFIVPCILLLYVKYMTNIIPSVMFQVIIYISVVALFAFIFKPVTDNDRTILMKLLKKNKMGNAPV